MGGEEFAILCVEEDKEKIIKHMEKIRHSVELQKVVTNEQNIISITISIGIAQKISGFITLDYLLKAADDALYEAKDTGRNRVIFRVWAIRQNGSSR